MRIPGILRLPESHKIPTPSLEGALMKSGLAVCLTVMTACSSSSIRAPQKIENTERTKTECSGTLPALESTSQKCFLYSDKTKLEIYNYTDPLNALGAYLEVRNRRGKIHPLHSSNLAWSHISPANRSMVVWHDKQVIIVFKEGHKSNKEWLAFWNEHFPDAQPSTSRPAIFNLLLSDSDNFDRLLPEKNEAIRSLFPEGKVFSLPYPDREATTNLGFGIFPDAATSSQSFYRLSLKKNGTLTSFSNEETSVQTILAEIVPDIESRKTLPKIKIAATLFENNILIFYGFEQESLARKTLLKLSSAWKME